MRTCQPAIRCVAIAILTTVAGCSGGGGDDGGTGPVGTPSISISLGSPTLSVTVGQEGQVVANVTRGGGYTGNVAVTTEGAPAGVTASVATAGSGSAVSATITVTAAAGSTPGMYQITVRATGPGVTTVTATLSLTIAPAPDIQMTVAPGATSFMAGTGVQVNVSLDRTNFSGPVTLSLEGAVTGLTGVFTDPAPTGNASTLVLSSTAQVVPGIYNLTIRAQATGVGTRTGSLALTITPFTGFVISANPAAPTIPTGQGANVLVTIARSNFNGAVTFSLEGGSAAISGAFNPAVTAGTQSTLSLTVSPFAAVGTFPLHIIATAAGMPDQQLSFPVTTTAVGGFTLTTTPAGFVNVAQNGNTPVTINIERTAGFNGIVAFSVTGAPAGLTATLESPQSPNDALRLDIAASGTLAPGSYALTIRGTSAGLPERIVSLTVNVSSANSGAIVFDYSTCAAQAKPLWFATQDGDGGPWQRIVPTGDRFAFDLTQKATIAQVFAAGGNGFTVLVQSMGLAEIQARGSGAPCTAAAVVGKSISGTIASVTAADMVTVAMGGAVAAPSAGSPAFLLSNVADGPQDVIATRDRPPEGTGSVRALLARDVNLADGGSLGTLDFTGDESFPLLGFSNTLNGVVAGEVVTHRMALHTRAACTANPLYGDRPVTGNAFESYGLPTGFTRSTDRHAITVTATTGATVVRSLTMYVGNHIGTRNFILPDNLANPTITVEPGPYKRLRTELHVSGFFNEGKSLTYVDTPNGLSVTLSSTAAYLGTALSNPVFEMPDFSAMPGWNNAWAPATNAQLSWTITANGIGQFGGACVLRGEVHYAARMGVK